MTSDIFTNLFIKYDLIAGFAIVSIVIFISYSIANLVGQKRMGSAIAIVLGLGLSYIGGKITGGSKGIADLSMFTGLGVLGGGMFRDYAIISTAYGAKLENLKKAGIPGIVSLFVGIFYAFFIGAILAYIMGFKDPIDIATIGAGTVTFIVGPITGTALGASSEVIALAIAAGVVKSVLTMILTPLIANKIKLDNPTSAMVYGGLMGTTSGVAGGLAATDPALVPYGAMTATFYTGLGSLLCPSVGFILIKAIF
ncbi:MAG: malonate transporter subunit MadM [Tissierellaceae bacterium]